MNEDFDKIYELYSKSVFRLVYSYGLSKYDSEDIVQKVFFKLFKSSKILQLPNDEIKKWLFRVSINEAKDILKSPWKKRVYKLENEKILENKTQTSNTNIINSLKAIPAEYRIPLYLYYYEGYKIKEIAQILKKSETYVKLKLATGKEKLKYEMER